MEEERIDYIEEKPTRRKTLKARAKKYLACFVLLMIVCTILSRATASVTTPMVSVITPKRGSLTYKIDGTGVIEASSEIFIPVEAEMKIQDVKVKVGDSVEEGQELFSYDMDALLKKIKDAKEALNTSERAYEKQQLSNSLLQAQTDLDAQQKALKRAQEDYDAAVEKLTKAKAEYKKKVQKIKENLSKSKQDEYNAAEKACEDAKESYDSVDETCEKAYNAAVKAVEKAEKAMEKAVADAEEELATAQTSLTEMTEKQEKLESYIRKFTNYARGKDTTKCDGVMEDIYTVYFGKNEYKTIKRSLADAENDLSQANEDLKILKEKWDFTLKRAIEKNMILAYGSDEYKEAYADYQELLMSQETELLTAQRRVDAAQESIRKVNAKYTEINDSAIAYREYLATVPEGTDTTYYTNFYNTIMDETILDQKEYKKAQELVSKKEQALSDTTIEQNELVDEANAQMKEAKEDWEKKLKKEKKNVEEAEAKLAELLKKDYSGDDDIATAWSAVESQRATVKTEKRALDDAKEALATAQESATLAQTNASIQDKIDAIDLETLKEDVAAKTEKVEELQALYDGGGSVYATVAGMVSNLDVTQQANVSGSEKVSITPTSCVFTGSFDKDNRKYVEEGATISCKLDTMEKSVDAEITSIRYDQVNNNYIFTATLPEGDYLPKTGGTYTYTQQSVKYDATVPLSALRCENNSYFVLVLSETETVLGTETVAYRVGVEVTSKDTQTAAITNVYGDMQIITGSSRNISEGDRVRIGNYE